jgi:hypothetical protein
MQHLFFFSSILHIVFGTTWYAYLDLDGKSDNLIVFPSMLHFFPSIRKLLVCMIIEPKVFCLPSSSALVVNGLERSTRVVKRLCHVKQGHCFSSHHYGFKYL